MLEGHALYWYFDNYKALLGIYQKHPRAELELTCKLIELSLPSFLVDGKLKPLIKLSLLQLPGPDGVF